MKQSLFEFLNKWLRNYVVTNDVLMLIFVIFRLFGIRLWIIEYACGFALCGFIALFIASFVLGFCWLYRSFLIHDFIVYNCIVFHREIGFGIYLTPLRYITIISGFILLYLLWRRLHNIN